MSGFDNSSAHAHILQTVGINITHPYLQHVFQNLRLLEKFVQSSIFDTSQINREGSYVKLWAVDCIQTASLV